MFLGCSPWSDVVRCSSVNVLPSAESQNPPNSVEITAPAVVATAATGAACARVDKIQVV